MSLDFRKGSRDHRRAFEAAELVAQIFDVHCQIRSREAAGRQEDAKSGFSGGYVLGDWGLGTWGLRNEESPVYERQSSGPHRTGVSREGTWADFSP